MSAADRDLPAGWMSATLPDLVGTEGLFVDGDWVESKDQDPTGAVRLIQLADIGDGEFRDRSARFMTPERADELRCTFLKKDDVLIARMPDPLGRACLFPGLKQQAVTVVDVCVVRPNRRMVDPRWLMHAVNASTFRSEVESYESGSTRKRISRKNLSKIELPVPPLDEQRRIVDAIEELFSDLNAGEAALRDARARLVRYRQSVLNAAVTGALTSEWRAAHPDAEPAEALLSRILEERREGWEAYTLAKYEAKSTKPPKTWKARYTSASVPETDDLPDLPGSWTRASPEQLAAPEPYALAIGPFGSNLKVDDYRDDGVPLVFVRNIRSGVYSGDSTQYVTPEKAAELAAHHVRGGDVLITKMGAPPGDADLYPETRPDAVITADCIKWRLTPSLTSHRYFVYATNAPLVAEQIKEITSGVAQQKVSLGRFRSLAYPLPPAAEQAAVVEEVEQRLSVADAVAVDVDAQLVRSKRLRRSILQRAFEGRLVPQRAPTMAKPTSPVQLRLDV